MRTWILIAALTASLWGTAARAADLPPAPTYQVVAPIAVARWTGFYIGANAGYGWANGTADLALTGNPFFIATSSTASPGKVGAGGIAGGQIGLNYQKGIAVIGVEIDGQWSGQQNTTTSICGFACSTVETTSITSFGTARVRFGLAFDNILVFASAGGAWSSAKDDATTTVLRLAIPLTITGSKVGWAVSSGVEIGFADNWSAKIEYLYIATDQITGSTPAPAIIGGGTITETANLRDGIVRVGLNYRFGGPF